MGSEDDGDRTLLETEIFVTNYGIIADYATYLIALPSNVARVCIHCPYQEQ